MAAIPVSVAATYELPSSDYPADATNRGLSSNVWIAMLCAVRLAPDHRSSLRCTPPRSCNSEVS
jgi:hypothetical protein